jgi:hypothetical protein
MIQKQELRHNNFVKDRGGKTLQIDYFELDKVCQKVELQYGQIGHPLTEYFDFLEPIVLTSEILESRFGFMCENRISQYFKKYLNEENSDCCYVQLKQVGEPIWTVGFIDKWCVNPYRKEIRFVHQLQNLWFMYADYDLETVAQHSI